MKKGCIKEEDLSAFADHELSGKKSRILEDHLANCLACREKLAEIKESDSLLRAFSPVAPSDDFDRNFWKKARELENSREKAGWLRLPWRIPRPLLASGFAAGCAALLLFAVVFNRESDPPVEREEIFMAEHLEMLDDLELIRHLDLMEDWEAINEMKDHT